MRRFLVLAMLGALAALAAALPAAAKGPATASLTGPGLGHALPVEGDGEGGTGTPLGSLVQFGGYFAQVFEQIPDPTLRTRPAGNLGPRYQITYNVPGEYGVSSGRLVQDVYPYAKPKPVTYMRAGQPFWGVNHTHGGWFVADARLKAALVKAGLPASPPRPGSPFPWQWTVVGVAALALLLLLAAQLRRRGVARVRAVRTTG